MENIGQSIPSARRRSPKLPIGERLKSRRLALGMTLQAVADASGLSAPFLSQAERNQTVPSLVSLTSLGKALGVDIGYFIEIPKDENIVSRADAPDVIAIDSPVIYHQLSAMLPDRKMDAILMIIPPGHRFPVDQRDGEDFLFVIEGELVSQVGEVRATLRAGDSMHFRSQAPHSAWNETDTDVKLLYVGTPSIFRSMIKN